MATTSSYQERKVRRRIVAVILLLLALALMGWLAYNYYANKHLPLPNVEAVKAADKILPPEYLFSVDGIPQSPLKAPQDVLVHSNGKIYVADTGHSRVAIFDRSGKYLSSFGKLTSGKALRSPVYLAEDKEGKVYVSDRVLSATYVFDQNGKYIRTLYPDNKSGFRYKPMEMAFAPDGTMYMTDIMDTHRLLAIAPNGKITLNVGSVGQVAKATEKPEKFYFPNGVVVDQKNSNVYVADSNNGRLQVFDKHGKFLKIIPTRGLPRGIDIDYKDRLLIVDALGHSVMVYSEKGELLTTFGVNGFGAGQFQYPNGIAYSSTDKRIYVTDRENNRVQVWVWGPEVSPSLVRPVKDVFKWWWLLPLLLFLLYLLSKRKKHVMHEDFLKAAIATERLEQVVKKMKRLHVTQDVMDRYKDIQVGDAKFKDVVKVKDYFQDLVDEFAKEFNLAKPEATILSAAKKGRGRIILLAENESLLDSADAVDVKNMNFGDFLERYPEK